MGYPGSIPFGIAPMTLPDHDLAHLSLERLREELLARLEDDLEAPLELLETAEDRAEQLVRATDTPWAQDIEGISATAEVEVGGEDAYVISSSAELNSKDVASAIKSVTAMAEGLHRVASEGIEDAQALYVRRLRQALTIAELAPTLWTNASKNAWVDGLLRLPQSAQADAAHLLMMRVPEADVPEWVARVEHVHERNVLMKKQGIHAQAWWNTWVSATHELPSSPRQQEGRDPEAMTTLERRLRAWGQWVLSSPLAGGSPWSEATQSASDADVRRRNLEDWRRHEACDALPHPLRDLIVPRSPMPVNPNHFQTTLRRITDRTRGSTQDWTQWPAICTQLLTAIERLGWQEWAWTTAGYRQESVRGVRRGDAMSDVAQGWEKALLDASPTYRYGKPEEAPKVPWQSGLLVQVLEQAGRMDEAQALMEGLTAFSQDVLPTAPSRARPRM
jgi:hypothetical protein